MRGALLFTCMTFACAHQARPPPLAGWVELRSDHFRLQTDLSPSAARVTLERLETLRSALQTAWSGPEDTPDTANVVVLADTAELLTFTDWLGLSSVSGSRPLIVTAARTTGAFEDALPNTTVLAHELTHVLARWRMPSAALWYELGGAPEQRADRVARARAELGAAATEAPGEALPRVALARLEPDPDARLAAAEVTVRANPDSREAAVFLAATLRDDLRDRPGRTEATARAVKLAPDDPDALSSSAVEQARTGQVPAALQTIGRAVSLAPWSPVVLRVEANLGRCEEALDVARRAWGVLPHRAPPELVDAVQRDLELIRGSCSRAQAPAR